MTVRTASPVESAKDAGLSYVTGREPGISRVPFRRGFRYHDPQGRVVRDPSTLRRIESLVIPPNWNDVWICRSPNGHLQATGRDARNRKQYRYHPRYRAVREETKYEKLVLFGRMLPRIRRRVKRDLSLKGLPREKVVAAVVRLMDLAHIRVGNEEYARDNHSYGLTTMRNRHVGIEGSRIMFRFRGKSGKVHTHDLEDRLLATIVKRCRDLPGHELFQYLDESGEIMKLDSGMVNEYLRKTTGEDITAKDFRTWHGTVYAAEQLTAAGASASETEAKHRVVAAVQAVAERLGNRPATCRKYYVHPTVLERFLAGELTQCMAAAPSGRKTAGLSQSERCVLRMLKAAARRGRAASVVAAVSRARPAAA